MPDLPALREGYRARKAELMASLGGQGSSTRGVGKLLKLLAREADATLKVLWAQAEFPFELALVAVGGYGRGELFPHSDVDVLVLMPDGTAADDDAQLKGKLVLFFGFCWVSGLVFGSCAVSF